MQCRSQCASRLTAAGPARLPSSSGALSLTLPRALGRRSRCKDKSEWSPRSRGGRRAKRRDREQRHQLPAPPPPPSLSLLHLPHRTSTLESSVSFSHDSQDDARLILSPVRSEELPQGPLPRSHLPRHAAQPRADLALLARHRPSTSPTRSPPTSGSSSLATLPVSTRFLPLHATPADADPHSPPAAAEKWKGGGASSSSCSVSSSSR